MLCIRNRQSVYTRSLPYYGMYLEAAELQWT